jgi:hypothetical protein
MKNSYDNDSSDSLPTHLFEWATTEKSVDGSTVARDIVKHDLHGQRKALKESRSLLNNKTHKRLDHLGEHIMSRLGQSDFDCGFSINEHDATITVSYDDSDDINNTVRNRHALKVVSEIAKKHGARILMSEAAGPGYMGTMTVGFPGIGFGAVPQIHHDFDPYASARPAGNKIADLAVRLGLNEAEELDEEDVGEDKDADKDPGGDNVI